jgi:hypothetical protein
MKITKAHVAGFRLLDGVDIALDASATMIVGRNNSGKTSFVEVFRKFLGSDARNFLIDDIPLSQQEGLGEALAAFQLAVAAKKSGNDVESLAQEDIYRAKLPVIELTLTVAYEEDDDLSMLSPFIPDLDPERFDATICLSHCVRDPEHLFTNFLESFVGSSDPTAGDFQDFVRKNFSRIFATTIEAVDARRPEYRQLVSEAELGRLLAVDFIYAQNQFDDLSSDTGHRLSKGFESFYKANQEDNAVVDEIAKLLSDVSEGLDIKYQDLFKPIFDDLKEFGTDSMGALPELAVISEFEAAKVVVGNARLYYSEEAGGNRRLPEAHNGLGYSRLIFTILQFISFYEDWRRAKPRPPLQLVFVEEPEAHLHPQMQSVFVKNIRAFMATKSEWNVQSVVTTHSSHIVAESGFGCIRYFDNSVQPLKVRDLTDFEELEQKSNAEALKFLKRYMVLERCDMFFADKVILIEGAVERLLLPEMIRKVAESLQHQYVSVIEVGGAYAHLFRGVVEFLNVQTLVITDIDSVDPKDHFKAVRVEPGMSSSNQTLAKWLPATTKIDDLLDGNAVKAKGRVAVAYQVPEDAKTSAGRSFEESFITANAAILAASETPISTGHLFVVDGKRLTEEQIRESAYDLVKGIDKKTDFAFDIMTLEEWIVPKYIREGLLWLSKTP